MLIRRRGGAPLQLLLLLVGLAAVGFLWSLPPPPAPPPTPPSSPPPPAASAAASVQPGASAAPMPRHVTRSLSELGELGAWSGRGLGPSDHALLFNRVPKAGSELLALLLQWLQAANGFRLVRLPGRPEHRRLSATEQEEMVTEVTAVLRREALPVAFHRHVYFTNFSSFDRQSPTYVNLVRDPVEKAMSRFYYSRATPNPRNPDVRRVSRQPATPAKRAQESFQRCVQDGWPECQYRSGQAYDLSIPYFCGHDPRCMLLNDEWALRTAKANIERYFPVVGVLEELNATLTVLESRLPLFFSGVQDLYFHQLLEPHMNRNRTRPKGLKPALHRKLVQQLEKEYDLYNWLKQRLMMQLKEEEGKTPLPGEAGQDRIAHSLHSRAHLLKQ